MDCRVCSRPKASKFNHYGATCICGSCRAFFMRAAQSDLYKTFFHSFDCVIDAENRKSCKKCRFEKCLQVGMKVSYVKTLEEKCQKMIQCQKNINTVIKRQVNLPEIFVERNSLEELHDTLFEAANVVIFECYIKNPGAFIAHLCQAPFNVVNTDEFESLVDFMDVLILKKNMQSFSEKDGISSQDADVLLRHNFSRFSMLYRALLFLDDNIEEYIAYGRNHRGESYEIEQLMIMMDQLGKTKVKLEYDTIFASPWAKSTEIEVQHRQIVQGIINWYLKASNGSATMDKCLLILMQIILLYNCDGIESQLKEPAKIRQYQAHYCNMLHRYLKCQHGPEIARILLSKSVMLVHETQMAYDLSQQRLRLM